MNDYIPATDADLLAWSTNFDAVITAAPTDYGLTAPQAAAFAALQLTWAAALAAATNPATRTPVAVAAKDVARSVLVASARQLGQIAQTYPAITDALLATAGLTVPDPVPSPIPAPATAPEILMVEQQPLAHALRYHEPGSAAPRARPFGATGCLVYSSVGLTPPAGIDDCKFRLLATRVPFVVEYDAEDAGKTAYYLCRWTNAKGQVGPVSDLFAATITNSG